MTLTLSERGKTQRNRFRWLEVGGVKQIEIQLLTSSDQCHLSVLLDTPDIKYVSSWLFQSGVQGRVLAWRIKCESHQRL